MLQITFYKNKYIYPDYIEELQVYGTPQTATPIGLTFKGGTLRASGNMNDYMSCNYISFVRDGITLYAWVDNVAVKSESLYEISYTVDAFRTYKHKIDLGWQFINRSPVETNRRDNLLGALQPEAEVRKIGWSFPNPDKRVLVVQRRVSTGEVYSDTPLQPTPYQFYFCEYNINDWTASTPVYNLMKTIIQGAKPQNIVTMYSIPHMDIADLPVVNLSVSTADNTVNVAGWRFLSNQLGAPELGSRLTTYANFSIGEDINLLQRVEHNVQLVIPEAGIISIPDAILKKTAVRLRMDVDLFSGSANYMIVSGSGVEEAQYNLSCRGGNISSIPIISDPYDTYMSANQNTLAVSLLGDVASIAGGVGMAMTGAGAAVGGAVAIGGATSLLTRFASIEDTTSQYSNPPAFLGSALGNAFNKRGWVLTTFQKVENADKVHAHYGYPYEMLDNLTIPSSGYIETKACNVVGDGGVPAWALQEVNRLFDNGLRVRNI